MKIFKLLKVTSLLLAAALFWIPDQGIQAQSQKREGADQDIMGRRLPPMRQITQAERKAAAVRAAARRAAAGITSSSAAQSGSSTASNEDSRGNSSSRRQGASPLSSVQNPPLGLVDYFGIIPNYALSKLPTLTLTSAAGVMPLTYAVTPGTGIRKFVNTLAGVGPANKNNLNNFIPLAVPFTTPPAGVPTDGDYYEIGLKDFTQQFHSDLPLTTQVRGYRDMNPAAATPSSFAADNNPHYLGPIILAQRNKPVRIKFTNELLPASSFFIPVDLSVMGAGGGPLDALGNPCNPNTSTACVPYSMNRATLHLHGGATPWISDGTPHQWVVPAGEVTPYKQGVSAYNVPDMPQPTPGDGTMTFFWTNQQSNRLMFYHDHAYGITRLNVYAGEAAGYLLHDPVEDGLITSGVIPNQAGVDLGGPIAGLPAGGTGGVYTWGIPLVIQDKTFVPPAAQLAAQDPTWNWGGEGNLWFPHVYMPNQAPDNPDASGANPMGRWDLGAWFWPPMTGQEKFPPIPCGTGTSTVTPGFPAGSMCPGTPNPSLVPEAFMDTPVINGTVYPTVTLPQGAYRFRILNAANDRMFNLSLFYAADKADQRVVCKTGFVGVNSAGVAYTYGTANSPTCTEVRMVPAMPHPQVFPLPLPEVPPDLDDTIPACQSTAARPDVHSLATDGTTAGLVVANAPAGLNLGAFDYNPATGLPGLTVPCWPSTWPTDGREGGVPDPASAGPPWIQIGTEGGFLPAPVVIPATPVGYNYNRRDIVVTNVQERGLFLGPAERADVIVDLSQVPAGSTLMLYNDSPAPVPGFDARLDYHTGGPDMSDTGGAPTPQPGYGPNIRTLMQIQVVAGSTAPFNLAGLQAALPAAFQASQPPIIVPETTYPAASFPVGATPPATDTYSRIQNTSLVFTPTTPLTLDPCVTPPPLLPGQVCAPMGSKAIHELFDLDFGRMNSILGTELPFTNFNTQTTIPLMYIDPPTEILTDGGTQLWKITHNGVDTHAIHFHLVNVQLINRIGWDGAIRPPDPNEIGWKETVRMNPLEDAVVAMTSSKPSLPFPIAGSNRLLDVTAPVHSTGQFSNIDPFTNNPVTVTNEFTDFGWEYVWHCHLLGHEENDMMRPLVFQVAAPASATNLVATADALNVITLNWTYIAKVGIPATGFQIQQAIGAAGAFTTIGTAGPTAVSFVVPTPGTPGTTYRFRVITFNATALAAPSNVATLTLLAAPTNLRSTLISTTQVIMTWTQTNTTGVTGYLIQRSPNGVSGWVNVGTTTGAAATTFRNSGLTTKTQYFYQVRATGAGGAASAFSNVLSVTTQ